MKRSERKQCLVLPLRITIASWPNGMASDSGSGGSRFES